MLHGVQHRADRSKRVAAIAGRGAGTDAERRAAVAARRATSASAATRVWTDTHWLRPGWAWPVALAALLGAAGSLASVAVAARRRDRRGGRRAVASRSRARG